MILYEHLSSNTSPALIAAIQHALRRIYVQHVTLTAPLSDSVAARIHFEGQDGSLEITIKAEYFSAQPLHVLLALEGMLFSPLPGIENVTELDIAGSIFDGSQKLNRIKTAMQNLVSISFDCDESQVFRLLTQTHGPSPPFPRLERVMVFGHEKKEEAGRTAQNPCTWTWAQRLRFQVHLSEGLHCPKSLVDGLRVGCHVEIFPWGNGNDTLKLWRPNFFPVSPNGKLIVLELTLERRKSSCMPLESFGFVDLKSPGDM